MNILNFLSRPSRKVAAPEPTPRTAEVASGTADNRVVMLDGQHFDVVGYYGQTKGIIPDLIPGDQVLVSEVENGVLIHAVLTPADTPVRASIGFKDDMLVIETQGTVMLKSGNATIELTKSGDIRVDGKTIHTVGIDVSTKAKKTLELLGGDIKLN